MSNTAHRNYPKPVPDHFVSDDVILLQQAMDLVDGDIHLLFAAIADLAPLDHEHVIADITGLSTALAGKSDTSHTHTLEALSDVGGTTVAPAGYLLVKLVDGTWGPASPASVIGAHQHVIDDVVNLQTALDGLKINAQILAATNVSLNDGDEFGLRKASDGTLIKRTLLQLVASLFSRFGAQMAAATSKATVVDADVAVLADSGATNATKKVTFLELWANFFKGKADAVYVPKAATAVISAGFTITPAALGTIASQTINPALGNYQHGTNNGAFTLTAPAADCAVDIMVTNGASAGSITFSGFTVSSNVGDPLTTTNGNIFLIMVRRINGVSTYIIKAYQ